MDHLILRTRYAVSSPPQLPNLLDNVTMIESNYDNMQGTQQTEM